MLCCMRRHQSSGGRISGGRIFSDQTLLINLKNSEDSRAQSPPPRHAQAPCTKNLCLCTCVFKHPPGRRACLRRSPHRTIRRSGLCNPSSCLIPPSRPCRCRPGTRTWACRQQVIDIMSRKSFCYPISGYKNMTKIITAYKKFLSQVDRVEAIEGDSEFARN